MSLFRRRKYIDLKPQSSDDIIARRERIPDNFATRCPNCKLLIIQKAIGEDRLCPKCEYHMQFPAEDRLKWILDDGSFTEWDTELKAYNPKLLELPQAIAANKLDALYDEEMNPLQALKDEFESQGIPVFGISAVSGEGVNELLYYLFKVLSTVDRTPKIFEKEFEVEYMTDRNLPYTVEKNEDGEYVVEGP